MKRPHRICFSILFAVACTVAATVFGAGAVSAERLYLFDVRDNSGEGSVHEALAVFSPRLRLPRLTISPRLEGGSRLVALGNHHVHP